MKIISIIYHFGSGHTTEMAKAVAKGAASLLTHKVNLQAIACSKKQKIDNHIERFIS